MGRLGSTQLKRDYFWNTLGSAMNALSSALLLLVVARVLGPYYGGIFSLAYAVGQQFMVIGSFEMRPIQATDVKASYPFGVYLGSRVVTCFIMVAALAFYAVFSNGLSVEALLLLMVSGLKLFDSAEDVFHGMFQQRGRLDIAGKAFFFRTLITFMSFSVACFVTESLLASCAFAWGASVLSFIVLNIVPAKAFGAIAPCFSFRPIARLLTTCFPLFIGVFLLNDLVNVPRYSIESFMTKDDQTIYAIIFMPALVINLLAGFIFKPLLTSLSESWVNEDWHHFRNIIVKGCFFVAIATVLVCAIAYPFGIPILSWLYGIDLSNYRNELMLLLVGGALNAFSVMLYYGLVTMRIQGFVTIGYAVADLASRILAPSLVSGMGIMGAVALYDISIGLVCLLFVLFGIYGFSARRVVRDR